MLIESLELRTLLAADLTYPETELASDFIFRAVSAGTTPQVQLLRTAGGTVVASATLTGSGDAQVNIRRSGLSDLRGDTIRFDLPSLNLLSTFVVSSGGVFTVNFVGGLDVATGLPLPVADDAVRLEGSGAYNVGFSFVVLSSSDITIAAGSPAFSGGFTAKSVATNSGQADTTDPTKVIAIPKTLIAMTSGSISATNITLQALSTVNVQIDATSLLGTSIRFGTSVVDSGAKVDISGSAALTASGTLTIDANSTVTSSVQRKPQADGNSSDDKTSDAAIAIASATSNASVHLGGTAVVTVGGIANVSVLNTSTVTSIADFLKIFWRKTLDQKFIRHRICLRSQGLARRAFQAQATKEFCDGSSRLGETVFGW
ncbi:MAG: hypothetical protein SGI77_15915, partial [Pirellulaceae bacterium]|nr:hypothetical protein [Pirellulaceae bacterium]